MRLVDGRLAVVEEGQVDRLVELGTDRISSGQLGIRRPLIRRDKGRVDEASATSTQTLDLFDNAVDRMAVRASSSRCGTARQGKRQERFLKAERRGGGTVT
jgi:hypothetical protein